MCRYFASIAFLLVFSMSRSTQAQPPSPNYTIYFEPGVSALVGGTATIGAWLDTLPAAQPIEGWSIGICHPVALLTPLSAVAGATTQTVKNGCLPDFLQINVNPSAVPPATPGVNQAVIICFVGCASLPPGTGYELLDITYDLNGPPGIATLAYCDTTLGGVLVSTVLAVAGQSIIPTKLTGTIGLLGAPAAAVFISGECNGDGISDLADGIHLINELFASGPASACPAACDTNADGALELDDAVLSFNFLFLSGPPPAAPFPGCGTRAGVLATACSYPPCP